MGFKRGSIIKRRMKARLLGTFFWHMGIYIGKDRVIHFAGEGFDQSSAALEMDSLEDFADGHEVKLHAEPANPSHGRAVCRFAKACYYDEDCKPYAFITNNCEDFCVECYEDPYEEAHPIAEFLLEVFSSAVE